MIRPRRLLAAATASVLTLALGGCAGTVSMEPADAADDPSCAALTVRLPETLAGQERRWTDAQATGAWGSPAAALLTCGVPEPGPTTQRCELVEGVYWIVDDGQAEENLFTFTTFDRTPAVQVFIDFDVISSADTLRALSPIIDTVLAANGRSCTDRPAEGTPAP